MARAAVCVCGAALGLLVALPTETRAQPADPPRISVGAGAGVAFPFHADFGFTAWAWDADLRIALSRRLLIEAAVGEWRRAETRIEHNWTVQTVTGAAGTVGRLEESTRHVQRSWQGNVLVTGALDRVRLVIGGGAGVLQYSRRFQMTVEDCSAGVVDLCGSTASTFSNLSPSLQGVGGADVGVTGALSAYGQLRIVIPVNDPGGSDLRITAGVRWAF
jgi:hypothetical protein